MHRLRVFKALRGSASLCPNLEYRAQGSAERWTAGLGIGAFARAAAVRAAAAPTSEASNKRSCPCVRIWRESLPPPGMSPMAPKGTKAQKIGPEKQARPVVRPHIDGASQRIAHGGAGTHAPLRRNAARSRPTLLPGKGTGGITRAQDCTPMKSKNPAFVRG